MAQGRRIDKSGVIFVSACLLGVPCRYNGTHAFSKKVYNYVKNLLFLPVCPEVMAGLGVPREQAWFSGGDGEDVIKGNARVTTGNEDVTALFIHGARMVIELMRGIEVVGAILKEGSPSCGVERVNIDGRIMPGKGILSAVLKKLDIEAISDEKITDKTGIIV